MLFLFLPGTAQEEGQGGSTRMQNANISHKADNGRHSVSISQQFSKLLTVFQPLASIFKHIIFVI